LLEPLRKPARLVALEFEEIIDEYVSELAPIQRFALERVQRGGEVCGQRRALGGIGVILWGGGSEPVVDAVKSSYDLRKNKEVGIGGGLADPVLQPRGFISRCAQHADHYAAMVVTPCGPVGREGIWPKSPVAVDGRRRKRGRGRGMSQ